MKNVFSATIKMNSADQLAQFINEIGPLVESVVITTTPVERAVTVAQAYKRIEPAQRPLRGSKVNDTILQELMADRRTVKQLKEALESANLSAGSLSTGIAALTKAGQIERVSEGVYGLRQAAE